MKRVINKSNKIIRPRAIIFDMDGVIVDSMPYHFISWFEALITYKVRVSCFDVYLKEGEFWGKSLKDFIARAGIKADIKLMKRIVAQKDRIFRKKFRRIFIPGSREILNELKAAGYRLALVTGTPRHEVNRILPKSLLRLFSCIVAGGEVPRGKPSPEPYLKAAQLLGVRPAVCLVVENAPLGIESAKKAGMNCVAVTTSLPPEYLKMADAVINDLCVIRLILKKGRL